MEVYFDNSATTRCSDGAKELMMRVLSEDYGNPSSLHGKGLTGETISGKPGQGFVRH